MGGEGTVTYREQAMVSDSHRRCRSGFGEHTVLIGALALSLVASRAAPEHKPVFRLTNGSMEETNEERGLPAGYSALGQGHVLVEENVAFEGKRSVKMVLRGDYATVALVAQVPCSVPDGKTSLVRARVRTHDLRGEAYIMIYRYPPPLAPAFYSAQRISGTTEWTTVEARVPAKKGGDALQIRLCVRGTGGRAWWDCLEAVVVEGEK
jgi:hypothetical protein